MNRPFLFILGSLILALVAQDHARSAEPITTFNDPAFQAWAKDVAALPAEKQVEAIAKKLVELNPDFDGRTRHKIEGGIVTELTLDTDRLVDISPVRALRGLRVLSFVGVGGLKLKTHRILSDLSPLQGLPLTSLHCKYTQISDLSPLRGMPLTSLELIVTPVTDLSLRLGTSPMRVETSPTGAGKRSLRLGTRQIDPAPYLDTMVSDLSPLKGMPLKSFVCPNNSQVSDLSPLHGMPLATLICNGTSVSDLTPLKSCKSLESLNVKNTNVTADGVAALQKTLPNCKIEWDGNPVTTFNDPAFQRWAKEAAALSAERQVDAVAFKLQQLNPGFDGKVMPIFENSVVTELKFFTHKVTDLSPVRALVGVKVLHCSGSDSSKGKLYRLAPLRGIPLTFLDCSNSQVSDLSPLEEMPLTTLDCRHTKVTRAGVAALQRALPNCKIEWDNSFEPTTPQPADSSIK